MYVLPAAFCKHIPTTCLLRYPHVSYQCKEFRQAAGRKIFNIGSTGSYIPCPYDAVYAATKSYLLSVSKGINAELKHTGVSLTVLCPGSTRTQFAVKAGMEHTLLFRLFVMEPEKVADIGYRAILKRKLTLLQASIINYLYTYPLCWKNRW
ncbi:MAG: SDR family NAD(P)-dependent oxidoreductase [Eubacteriales bacterium]|nr:SDR family NAD(P)-dependent oxidoreductase [Eubacteriales bacterium]